MRLLLFLCLFCLPTVFGTVACATSRPQAAPGAVAFFFDPLGKEYFLLSDGQFITQNPLGQNDFFFFDSSLGIPDVIDVTNPFAVLLYYADYGTVVVLDRTLNEISRLDFFDLDGIDQPVTLARATDNGIWIFDSWDYRLKLLDQRSTISQQSNDLRLEINTAEAPGRIYVFQSLVLLHYTEENRLAIFTNYGRFDRWVDLPPATDFGYHNGRLMGLEDRDFWIWDIRDLTLTRGELPEKSADLAGTQVQSGADEQCLPVSGGYRRLVRGSNKTKLEEIK